MNDQIDYIMNKFNFERVHVAMTALDWKWNNNTADHSVPTVARLKQTAKSLLQTAAKEKITTGTGGFQAKYCPPESDPKLGIDHEAMLVLSFVLIEVDSEYYD
jgi:hypothetical protein